MLQLGNSQHWSVALKELTGKSGMDAQPLLDYFQPLHDWLKKENLKHQAITLANSSSLLKQISLFSITLFAIFIFSFLTFN